MIDLFSRHYKKIIFVFLLILSFVFMTLDVQVSEDTSFLEKMIFEIYYPFQQGVTWLFCSTKNLFTHYVFLVNLVRENENLIKEISLLEKKLKSMERESKENYKFRSMLGFSFSSSYKLILADVICRDSTKQFDSIFINKGSLDGIGYNFPIITDAGVVGKVVKVSPHVSLVQTIVDTMSRISVKIERTGEEGITKGFKGELLVMDFVPSESRAKEGDLLYTSGYGTIYPSALEVGSVIEIMREQKKMTKTLVIKPSVNFKEVFQVFIIEDKNFKEIRENLEDSDR